MLSAGSPLIDLDLERDGATPAARLAMWRDAMHPGGEVAIPDEGQFTGRFLSRGFGDMRIMRIEAGTFRFTRDRSRARRIRRDHVIVNLVERGRFVGRIAGRRIEVRPGSLLLSRLASPMDLVLEDSAWLALFFPRSVFETHMAWTPAFDARVFGPGSAQAVILGGLLRSLHELPDPLPAREGAAVVRSAIALSVACLGGGAVAPRVGTERGDDTSRAIRRFIAERLADPELSPDLLCREFDISRSRLYRLMGESADIASLIRRMRLHAAHRQIVAESGRDAPLAGLGRRWGFTDERSFRRAFVREFGHPPSALRRREPADTPDAPSHVSTVGADLERWFLGL